MGLRLSAAGIFLLGALGLLLHSTLPQTGHIRAGMFCFYTNLSNLAVLLYELALAIVPAGGVRRLLTGSTVALAMTLCIYVTHLVYHFVLVPDARRRGQKFADFGGSFGNLCVHYGTPWLVVMQWVLWGDKSGLTVLSAVWWLVLPLAYFAYAMLRARDGQAHRPHQAAVPIPVYGLGKAGPQKVLPQRGGGAGGVFRPGLYICGPGTAIGIGGMTMETEVKLTKLAACAGCGAKVGAGTLAKLLDGFRTHSDPRLLVGYDKSDDASVYYLEEHTALVQTTDFFPPIVDDPFLYGQIAAANAISDVYAMGGEPKLALNILCLPESMTQDMVQELLRGGYDKAYEAGAIITGGHTIHGAEPIYGLAVSGFVDPRRILTNSGARPGDVLLLTKPLGVGVLTTAAKAGLVGGAVMDRIYRQMATLNRAARDIMVKYRVHSCTDVTGFALAGPQLRDGPGQRLHRPYPERERPLPPEAWDLAAMGLIPAGAYRNRDFAQKGVTVRGDVSRTMQDLLYDPQTSGGLLMAVDPADAAACLRELRDSIPAAAQVGYVTEKEENWLILE